jgi:chromate transporter
MMDQATSDTSEQNQPVSFRQAIGTWCRVALLSFGGPAGQIAVMHRILVDEKKWVSEERFLHALNYCMLLPGPEAQQLATYIGWLMHRTKGGLAAGILFILPGFVAILALSIAYACYEQTSFVQALFFGLKPAVLAIVLEAVFRIGKRVLKNSTMVSLAVASFIAIFFFSVPFPVLILVAALIGFVGGRFAPGRFYVIKGHGSTAPDGLSQVEDPREAHLTVVEPSLGRSLKVLFICLTLWFVPLALVGWLFGRDSTFFQEGIFFSQAAVVTFGGAYSVLMYIAQQAVDRFGWLQPGEMLDGLGMAETTPGPLIMVVQFVGFMGAYRHPGALDPLAAGILGSILTTWVTFVPCFLWIFLGAPYIERLRGNRLLSSALSSITATVVGVILNLAVWFAVHTLFARVSTQHHFGMTILTPEWSTISYPTLAIATVACLLTFYGKRGMALTLTVCSLLGIAYYLLAK